MPAESITINATWNINSYKLIYKSAGVNHAEYDVVYGTAAADMPVPEEPVREGYTFKGWLGIPATMPAKDTTVTANWAINQYTITFADTGDTVIDPITQNYNTDIEVPEDPTKTGYTFNGWSPAVPAKMPAENVTITAQWTINQYTITFDTDGGSTVSSITQDYDTAITAPENPTK